MKQFTKRGKTVERKNTIYDTIMEIKSSLSYTTLDRNR